MARPAGAEAFPVCGTGRSGLVRRSTTYYLRDGALEAFTRNPKAFRAALRHASEVDMRME